MDWRAQWYEAGWSGEFPDGAAKRRRDMAEVEQLAGGRVPPCQGQRVQRALHALNTRRTQVHRIVLCDDPQSLPASWRNLLDHLGYEIAEMLHAVIAAELVNPEQTDSVERAQALLVAHRVDSYIAAADAVAAACRDAIEGAGKPVAGCWIHFPVAGGIVDLLSG